MPPSTFENGDPALARTKAKRQLSEAEELQRWRQGLETALHAPPRRRRFVRGLGFGLVLIIVLALAGGFYYWRVIGGLFKRVNVTLAPASGGALNVLMVGSDSREGLDSPEDVLRFGRVGGRRADTIILAQVIPGQQRGVLLHIPRDLWTTVHAEGRQFNAKVNSAYNYGPQSIVDTVGSLTGVPINHYIEINFGGFRRMVDAVGGIDVCNDQTFYDPKINFRLDAGLHHLDGEQALSYVRTRRATPDGDFGRIRRQQEFVRAVMSTVGKPSVLGNPVRVNSLATSFAQNVTVDQTFHLNDLIGLAIGIRRVGPDQLRTYAVPGHVGRVAGQSVVIMEKDKAEPLFEALRNVSDPSDVVPTTQAAAGPRGVSGIGILAQASPCPAAGVT